MLNYREIILFSDITLLAASAAADEVPIPSFFTVDLTRLLPSWLPMDRYISR